LTRPIALLTDFGHRDAYVGVMKGAILTRNPNAVLVDVGHDVPPQDVRRAAFLLATSVSYFPVGTIFLVVVDPGVGTSRRAIALEAGPLGFVGPDNGVLTWALRLLAHDGQIDVDPLNGRLQLRRGVQAVELTVSRCVDHVPRERRLRSSGRRAQPRPPLEGARHPANRARRPPVARARSRLR
jgi:hypothetical protein